MRVWVRLEHVKGVNHSLLSQDNPELLYLNCVKPGSLHNSPFPMSNSSPMDWESASQIGLAPSVSQQNGLHGLFGGNPGGEIQHIKALYTLLYVEIQGISIVHKKADLFKSQ